MENLLSLIEKYDLRHKTGIFMSGSSDVPKGFSSINYIKPEVDQLFQLKGINEDSMDYIIDSDDQLATKFFPIVLLEYFYRLKRNGKIIIFIRTSDENELLEFKGRIAIFLRGKFRICEEVEIHRGRVFVLNKLMSAGYDEKGIDFWTFGIVTGGKRHDWIETQIQSIVTQGIPNFEIIICGDYFERPEKYIKYIPLHQDPPRITTKKNVICRNARYENIIILHDRVYLDKGWFKGMKRFGNLWDVVGCQLLLNGKRSYDWTSAGCTRIDWSSGFLDNALLEYKDWDPYVSVMGAIHIFKRSAWQKVKFNEGMYYPDFEDKLFCNELTFSGHIIRFNPYSICTTPKDQELHLRKHRFDTKRLGRVVPNSFSSALLYYPYLLLYKLGLLSYVMTYFKRKISKLASVLGKF